jgi:hypothetical protein
VEENVQKSIILQILHSGACWRGVFIYCLSCNVGEAFGLRNSKSKVIHLPAKFAARFSRNAEVPSFLSSVAQETANKVASRKSPSCWLISIP